MESPYRRAGKTFITQFETETWNDQIFGKHYSQKRKTTTYQQSPNQ